MGPDTIPEIILCRRQMCGRSYVGLPALQAGLRGFVPNHHSGLTAFHNSLPGLQKNPEMYVTVGLDWCLFQLYMW